MSSGGRFGAGLRLAAAGIGAVGVAAVGTEAALARVPPSDLPFSGPVHARVEIGAPVDEVWAATAGTSTIVDWEEALVPPILPHLGWIIGRPIVDHENPRARFMDGQGSKRRDSGRQRHAGS